MDKLLKFKSLVAVIHILKSQIKVFSNLNKEAKMNVSDAVINPLLESDGECPMDDAQVANLIKILKNTKIPNKNKTVRKNKKTTVSAATTPVKDDNQQILIQILEGIIKLQRDVNNMRQESINLGASFDAALTEISSLKTENADLGHKSVIQNEKIISLDQRIDDMEQRTKNDEIIISGSSVKFKQFET